MSFCRESWTLFIIRSIKSVDVSVERLDTVSLVSDIHVAEASSNL